MALNLELASNPSNPSKMRSRSPMYFVPLLVRFLMPFAVIRRPNCVRLNGLPSPSLSCHLI